MTETVACPLCESDVSASAKKCRHCGEWISRSCEDCGTPLRGEWAARGRCSECVGREGQVRSGSANAAPVAIRHKSRGTAVFLALVLGGIGAHKFYVDKPGMGFLYLIFAWTFIPALVGLLEAIQYLVLSDAAFQRKYADRTL